MQKTLLNLLPLRAMITTVCVVVSIASAADSGKPNVLLVCVDDLKPLLGCYGDPHAKTPNLDRLAKRAVVMESAYCNQAVCAPSRNALMTGLRPQTLGIYDLGTNFRKSRPDAVTMSQHFQKQGYRTEAMGKIFHVGHGNGEDAASWDVPHFSPWKVGNYKAAENLGTSRSKDTKGPAYESADVADEAYPDGFLATEAIRRLSEAKKRSDTPFFMGLGFAKPHLPFSAPKKYWDMHDPAKLPLATVTEPPLGAPSYAPQFGGELRSYGGIPANGALPTELQRKLVHGYYAATSYMDAQLGRVLDKLDELKLTENTIIVLWGDHGWHLGDHGMWCKHTNYEQAARIPLLIAAPGISAAHSSALVETVDIYPTLSELAGLSMPKGLDGVSFAKVLRNPDQRVRDSIIHVYPRNKMLGRAIRTPRHRMVEWKAPGAETSTAEYELYDYEKDPLETKNLAASQPEILASLKTILATHPEAKPQIKAAKQATAKPAGKPKADRGAMFDQRDKNKDLKLTRDEFLAGQKDSKGAPARFLRFDKDKNSTLSRDEFIEAGK
jgi:iduronate 2-sulfatase